TRRRTAPTTPTSPEPSRTRDEGSGTVGVVGVTLTTCAAERTSSAPAPTATLMFMLVRVVPFQEVGRTKVCTSRRWLASCIPVFPLFHQFLVVTAPPPGSVFEPGRSLA